MIIVSVSENKNLEKRISITPEIAKKYINLGLEVQLSKNYGKHLGFKEKEYNELGVKFIDDDKKLIENADIIINDVTLSQPFTGGTNYARVSCASSDQTRSRCDGLLLLERYLAQEVRHLSQPHVRDLYPR